jgi:hypothetical protein
MSTLTVPAARPFCDRDAADPDGGCGCGRSFDGVDHHRATTTAKVVETDLDQRAWREIVRLSLTHAGWHTMDDFDAFYISVADDMIELAADLPVGTVLGRRIDQTYTRS